MDQPQPAVPQIGMPDREPPPALAPALEEEQPDQREQRDQRDELDEPDDLPV